MRLVALISQVMAVAMENQRLVESVYDAMMMHEAVEMARKDVVAAIID